MRDLFAVLAGAGAARGFALALLLLSMGATPLSAQTRADTLGLMRALGAYVLHGSVPGPIGLRAGFDVHRMPGASARMALRGIEGPAASPLVELIRGQASGRIQPVPLPPTARERAAVSRGEAGYATAFAFGGFSIRGDTALVAVTRTFNHEPRPSTFTTGEYLLTFAGRAPGEWRLVSDSLLTVSDGVHDFAPPENLLEEDRALLKGRGRPPG